MSCRLQAATQPLASKKKKQQQKEEEETQDSPEFCVEFSTKKEDLLIVTENTEV